MATPALKSQACFFPQPGWSGILMERGLANFLLVFVVTFIYYEREPSSVSHFCIQDIFLRK